MSTYTLWPPFSVPKDDEAKSGSKKAAGEKPVADEEGLAPLPTLSVRAERLQAAKIDSIKQGLSLDGLRRLRRALQLQKIGPHCTIVGGLYHVPTKCLPPELWKRILRLPHVFVRTVLPANVRKLSPHIKAPEWNLWRDDILSGMVSLPRFAGGALFGPPGRILMSDGDAVPPSLLHRNYKLLVDPYRRLDQNEICDATEAALRRRGGAMVIVPCGWGKTVMFFELFARFGTRALFVSDQRDLIEQPCENAAVFLPDIKTHLWNAKRPVPDDAHLVFTTIQFLRSRKDIDIDLMKTFGLVAFDEATYPASEASSKVFRWIKSKYIVGFTATPDSAPAMQPLAAFMGEPAVVKLAATTKAGVVFSDRILYYGTQKPTLRRVHSGFVECRSGTLTALAEDAARNALVGDIALTLHKDGHKVLVISFPQAVAEAVYEYLCTRTRELGSEISIMLYHGKVTPRPTLPQIRSVDILVATYSMCGKGFDDPTRTAEVLATPQSSVVQAHGRVMRGSSTKVPVIVSIDDQHLECLKGSASSRRRIDNMYDFKTRTFTARPQVRSSKKRKFF
jgi:hypothetical protein